MVAELKDIRMEKNLEDISRKLDSVIQLITSLAPKCPKCGSPMVARMVEMYAVMGVDKVYALVFECPKCKTKMASNLGFNEVVG